MTSGPSPDHNARMIRQGVAVALIGSLVGACGGSSAKPAAEPEPAPPAAAAVDDVGEGIAWADKSRDQKIAVMKTRVVPAVAAIWGESPEPDEEVNCVLCHGVGAKEGKFDMPSPSLPALDPRDGFAAHADDAEWLAFMGQRLMPTMLSTLEVAPYDPETHEGFGCLACHTRKRAE